jgi:hypothetical protein
MKVFISILSSVIIFGASFQNSLYFIDYLINKDYYESICLNKQKPEMACTGKCQIKKEAQEKENPLSEIKYSLELNIVINKTSKFLINLSNFFIPKNIFLYFHLTLALEGHYLILPNPPQN